MINTKLNRSKVLSFFVSLLVVLNLTSCEGFFTDNGIDDKIRAAIEYANAPFSTFLVSAENNTGTIIPSGTKQYKPTDYYTIEFTLDPGYEFLEWEFQYRMLEKEAGTATLTATDKNWWKDYINIIEQTDDVDSKGRMVYTIQIQFVKSTDNLLIIPRCGKKPGVDEWKPTDDKAGVSSQSEISIKFDSELSPDSFIYSKEELDEIAELEIPSSDYLRNNAGKVYGYKYKNNTIFKSIKIFVDGSDYTGAFSEPVIETIDSGNKKYSRVMLSPKEVLPCPDDETKTSIVSIELDSTIKTIENVTLTPVKYQYRINSKPLDYSYVDMSGYNPSEGQPTPSLSPLTFAVSKNINLSFNENPNYQFLHWETNNENIKFADDDITRNPTTFYSMVLVRVSDQAKIIPVSAPRPKFNLTKFNYDYTGVQPRDQDIKLTFDKPVHIPDDAKILISCSGKGDVTSSFDIATIPPEGTTEINIIAKKDENRINVSSGETPKIVITIPDSIYYIYHDEVTGQDVKVTIGNTITEQPSYKIDSTTQDKAHITFKDKQNDEENSPSMGTITVDNIKKIDGTLVDYDIDKQISIKFKENDDFTFLYWINSNSNVEIKDPFAESTELTVKQPGACTIRAKCAPKLKLSLKLEGESPYFCDSDILIESNIKPKTFSSDPRQGNSVNSVTVSYNGVNMVGTYYSVPEIYEDTINNKFYIRLTAKKKLSVPQTGGSVIVNVDGTFYYEYFDTVQTDPVKIGLVGSSYSETFAVSEKTKKQVYVKLDLQKVSLDQETTNNLSAYKIGSTNNFVFNEDSSFKLNFSENTGYQFIRWNLTGDNTSPLSIEETEVYGKKYYELKIGKVPESVQDSSQNLITLNDVSAEKLKVLSVSPSDTSSEPKHPRDSSISISFKTKPEDDIINKIRITCDGYSVADSFDLAGATFSGNVLTILAKPNNRISVSPGTTRKVKVTIPSDAYYLCDGERITLYNESGSNYEHEYTIDDSTNNKVKVNYQILYGEDTTLTAGAIKCDDVTIASSNIQPTQQVYYMNTETHTLSFTEAQGYQFLYWDISAPNDFKLSTTTPKTNKTVQFVTNNQANDAVTVTAYCAPRLSIESFEPSKTSSGVAKDSDIIITFNKKPDLEIANKITITSDGNPANSNFLLGDNITNSSFSGTGYTTLTIKADPAKKLSVPESSTRTVTVSVSSDAYYVYTAPDGDDYPITCGKTISKEYIINQNTTKQAKVTYGVYVGNSQTTAGVIKCDNAEVPSTQITYNMDNVTRTLSFVENSDYQFLYWVVSDTNAIRIADRTKNPTTFIPVGNNDNVTIRAYCAPRLKLTAGSPADDPDQGVARDYNIVLTFNNQPELADCKDSISISYNGNTPATTSFPTDNWVWSSTTSGAYKLSIPASTSNRISVPAGAKYRVKVTVPASLSYTYTPPSDSNPPQTTYQVSCGTDQVHEYTISSTTRQKATVTFNVYEAVTEDNVAVLKAKSTAGDIKVDNETPSSAGKTYNMDGASHTLSFTASDDYQFLYWLSSDNTIIQIPTNSNESLSSSFVPVGTSNSESDVEIKAVCAPRLRVTGFTPGNIEEGVEQDSNITITFNYAPANGTNDTNNISSIKVYRNNSSDSRFSSRSLSGTTVTLNTTKITASSGRVLTSGTANMKVVIPSTLYYTYTAPSGAPRTTYHVKYGGSGDERYYTINSSTVNKVTVKAAAATTAGSIEFSPARTDNKYSIGEKITATFIPTNEDYLLTGWTRSATAVSFSSTTANPVTITVNSSSTTTHTITAGSKFLTKISSITPETSSTGVPCDTPIKIYFNKKMSFESLSKGTDIKLYDQYLNDISNYFTNPDVTTVDDKTVVTVKIKSDYSIREIFGNNNTAVVQVQLKSELQGADNISLSTSGYEVQNNYITFMYRINKQTEDDLPEFNQYKVYYNNTDTFEMCTPSSTNKFDGKNHIYDTLSYNFKISDETSGFSGRLDIDAKVIYDKDGNDVSNGNTLHLTRYYPPANQFVDTLNFSTDFPDGEIEEECMIQLDFTVYDNAGNSNTITYYVAMDRTLDMKKGFIYNRYGTGLTDTQLKSDNYASTRDAYEYNMNPKTSYGDFESCIGVDTWPIIDTTNTYLYFRYPKDQEFIKFNGTSYTDSVTTVSLYFGTNQQNVENESSTLKKSYNLKFEKDDYVYFVFKNLTVSKTAKTYIKIIAQDIGGCKTSLSTYIPESPSSIYLYEYRPGTAYSEIRYENGYNSDGYTYKRYCAATGVIDRISLGNLTSSHANRDNTPGRKYLFEASNYLLNNKDKNNKGSSRLYSDLRSPPGNPFTYSETHTPNTISGVEYISGTSNGYNSGNYTVKLKITNHTNFNKTNDLVIWIPGNLFVYKMDSDGCITLSMSYASYKSFCTNKTIKLALWQNGYVATENTYTVSGNIPTSATDNIAPNSNDTWGPANFGDVMLINDITDSQSELKTVTREGKVYYEYEYIIVPEDITQATARNNFASYNPVFSYSPVFVDPNGENHCFLRVPKAKECNTFFRIKDTANNYYITYVYAMEPTDIEFHYAEIGNNIPLTVTHKKGATNQLQYTATYNDKYINEEKKYYLVLEHCDSSVSSSYGKYWETNYQIDQEIFENDGDVTFKSLPELEYNLSGKSNNATSTATVSYTSNTFYRAMVISDKTNSLPLYHYTGNATCNIKNVLSGSTGVTIMCDNPTLYYCCFSLYDYGDNQDEWEVYGAHTVTNVISTSKNADTSGVPKGAKYVVIAHFADNTSAMSSVMTK